MLIEINFKFIFKINELIILILTLRNIILDIHLYIKNSSNLFKRIGRTYQRIY